MAQKHRFTPLSLFFFLFLAIFAGAQAPDTGTAGALLDTTTHPGATIDTLTDPTGMGRRAVVVTIVDQVDYGLFAFLKRAVEEARELNPDWIVFSVNTYGGELHSTFEIADLLLSIDFCSTITFVDQKAISAGALIALGANRLFMQTASTMGDAAPITQTQEGIQMLGEKIQSPLRAKFRTLAERNNYPSLLAEAFVTVGIGVVAAFPRDTTAPIDFYTVADWAQLEQQKKTAYRVHETVVDTGSLLTLTDREAARYGMSEGSYPSLNAFLTAQDMEVVARIETNWSENLVRAIGKIAPILMLIGFGALYLEFKTPGFSVFGILGIVCLGVVFGSKYAVGLADHTELLLIAGGFILFMVEIYLFPGTLFFAATGIAMIAIGLILSLQAYTLPDPEFPWQLQTTIQNITYILALAVGALFIPFLATRFLLPHLPAAINVIPNVTLKGATTASEEVERITVGMTGRTQTGLRPAGKALFDGKGYEVHSRGGFIAPDKSVQVISIVGNKITVKETDPTA